MATAPRTLLADDHTIVAEGLSRLLIGHCDLVGIASDGPGLVAAAVELQPEVIIADLSMPGLSGLEAIPVLRARGVTARIIILTMYSDPQLARNAIEAGALGYVLKQAAGQELLAAIEAARADRVYVSPQVALGSTPPSGTPQIKLTPRQREILALIARGYRMKQIATTLRLSRRTVEAHKYEMMRALGVRSTIDLVRYAASLGLTQT
ncbi:MAG TPA: response regulator transcription factor [Vicinamibacterales bacterium]|nr:response regulator transcription factor [Vicinamibacterales bacterium]